MTFYRGLPGAAFSTFDQIYKGTADGVFAGDNTVSIALRDPLVELDKIADIPKFGGFGQCVRLDGTGDYVDCGEVPAVWLTGTMTLEARSRLFTDPGTTEVIAVYDGPTTASAADNNVWKVSLNSLQNRLEIAWEHGTSGSE